MVHLSGWGKQGGVPGLRRAYPAEVAELRKSGAASRQQVALLPCSHPN